MKNRLCILSVLLVVRVLQGVSGLNIDTRTPTIVNSGLPDGGTVGFGFMLTQHCLQMDERRECVTLNFSAAQPCPCVPYL